MGNPAPTIKDVAARAGVSIATASNVVNGNRPVGNKSWRAVETAIAELGYRVNRAASSLRGQPSRLIGMVVPEIENVYFAGLVHRAEKEAERDGYDLLIASSSEDPAVERRRVEALVGRKVDGLLIAPYHDSPVGPFTDRALRNSLPPTVLIDRGGGVEGLDTVDAATKSAPTMQRAISSNLAIATSQCSPTTAGWPIFPCALPATGGRSTRRASRSANASSPVPPASRICAPR